MNKSTQSLLIGFVLGMFFMHHFSTLMHQDTIIVQSMGDKGPKTPTVKNIIPKKVKKPIHEPMEDNTEDTDDLKQTKGSINDVEEYLKKLKSNTKGGNREEVDDDEDLQDNPLSKPVKGNARKPGTPSQPSKKNPEVKQASKKPSSKPKSVVRKTQNGRQRLPKPEVSPSMSNGEYVYSHVLNEYVKKAGSAAECERDMGFSLANNWVGTRKSYCDPASGVGNDFKPKNDKESALYCFRYLQSGHSGPDSFCQAYNMILDYSGLRTMTNGKWQAVAGEYRYFESDEGTLKGACTKNANFNTGRWPQGHFQQILLPTMAGYGGGATANDFSKCTKVIEHPTLFVARDGKWNLYHSMADFVNAFLVLEALKIASEDVQVVIFDQDVKGPYIPFWQKAFSPNHPVQFGGPLKEKGETICYKNAIVALPGVSSFMCKDISRHNPCEGSDMLNAFGQHVIRSFDLQEVKVKAPVVITLISRRPHPEKKNMDRTVVNEPAMVKAVQDKYPESEVVIRCLDFAEFPFEKQLEIVHESNVLAGVHGAGLTHLLWLPHWKQKTAVIEYAPTYGSHYDNLARWGGSKYIFLSDSSPTKDLQVWLQGIEQAVQHVKN